MPHRRFLPAGLLVQPGQIKVRVGEVPFQLQRALIRLDRLGPPAQCLERGPQIERGSRVGAAGPERPAVVLYGFRDSSLQLEHAAQVHMGVRMIRIQCQGAGICASGLIGRSLLQVGSEIKPFCGAERLARPLGTARNASSHRRGPHGELCDGEVDLELLGLGVPGIASFENNDPVSIGGDPQPAQRAPLGSSRASLQSAPLMRRGGTLAPASSRAVRRRTRS